MLDKDLKSSIIENIAAHDTLINQNSENYYDFKFLE